MHVMATWANLYPWALNSELVILFSVPVLVVSIIMIMNCIQLT